MPLSGLVHDADVFRLLGPEIGRGSSRKVYEYRGESDLVIKEHGHQPHMQNFTEWFIWIQIAGTPIAGSFGVCHAMSTSGRYLVMERLDDLSATDPLITFPRWTTDNKHSAQGRNGNGDVKIRDYGNVRLGSVL
ncbi:hypothetical protein [Acetobacter senegalensis]|uniref:hypothetical protein n=1 Tax=Acetobacter senegalensis TaxID=446692 RepID=UPI002653EE08|nr:hypothetical protein [Acetobacter senegalensis]MDN7352050.1 hypothetical protein [Acetobacter senegalensis]